ncbi:hypothetical protein Lal_00018760 [Lupinus albus]|nr:hypothetical protein Lal_00018760 [Lupinus albus]
MEGWFVGKHNPLLCAIIITTVLNYFGISTAGESKIELDVRDSEIDLDVIHKMSLSEDPNDMLFKHQNDQHVVPPNNPTTTQPDSQPSQSQFDSSSSSNGPYSKIKGNIQDRKAYTYLQSLYQDMYAKSENSNVNKILVCHLQKGEIVKKILLMTLLQVRRKLLKIKIH